MSELLYHGNMVSATEIKFKRETEGSIVIIEPNDNCQKPAFKRYPLRSITYSKAEWAKKTLVKDTGKNKD